MGGKLEEQFRRTGTMSTSWTYPDEYAVLRKPLGTFKWCG